MAQMKGHHDNSFLTRISLIERNNLQSIFQIQTTRLKTEQSAIRVLVKYTS